MFNAFCEFLTRLANHPYVMPPVMPNVPVEPPAIAKYLWDTPEDTRHSIRVICDECGLAVSDKNIICAVIEAESGFKNSAKNYNRNSQGIVTSTDWGLCQINDRYHIGPNNDFPSVAYVLSNPEQVVRWMIHQYNLGHINWWCAHSNGSYKKYL